MSKITVMRLCPGGDCAVIEIDNTLEEFYAELERMKRNDV